jgi:hypothetical protein
MALAGYSPRTLAPQLRSGGNFAQDKQHLARLCCAFCICEVSAIPACYGTVAECPACKPSVGCPAPEQANEPMASEVR